MTKYFVVHYFVILGFVAFFSVVVTCEPHGGILRPRAADASPNSAIEKRFQGSEHRKIADSIGFILLIAGPGEDNFTNPDNSIIQLNESISNLQFINSQGILNAFPAAMELLVSIIFAM